MGPILVDDHGRALYPGVGYRLPVPRTVSALGMVQGRLVAFPRLVADLTGAALASPDGDLIGAPQVWISRLTSASRF
jgi:hypothetical protein